MESVYCSSCGAPVIAKLNAAENQVNALESISENTLERVFVGKNYDYFQSKWRKGNSAWNWAAFLIGFAWLPYRKMYLYSFIFMGCVVLEFLCEYAFDLPQSVSNAINIGIAVTFGIQGNYWYRLHVEKMVKEITARNTPQNAHIEAIRKGGTNFGAAIGFVVTFICILILVFVVAEG